MQDYFGDADQEPGRLGHQVGPRGSELLERQRQRESGAVSYPTRLPVAIARARGSYIEDVDGNVVIDFLTGAGSLPLGHNHPEVMRAAREQLDRFTHGLDFPTDIKDRFTSAQLSMLSPALAERMKVHFCGPTGADAVEAAVKLCKLFTGGDEVLSFSGGYHGCTHAGLSLSSVRSMKAGIGNRVAGVHFFPYSDCNRCALGLRRSSCQTNCAGYFRDALDDSHSGLGRPAAVLLELVQGEGGVVPADTEFVRQVRAAATEHAIPLIVDEIQTGCGRTGTWFAFEQYGIEPDVIVVSKGLSGMGSPVSLMFYRREMDLWQPGMHIGTFRGNQLAFAAGVATIEVMTRDRVLDNVQARSSQLLGELHRIKRTSSIVGDIRGKGLMIGCDIVSPESGRVDADLARHVQRAALENGLMLELGGRSDTVLRMLPPLNISERIAAQACEILERSLRLVEQRHLAPRASQFRDLIAEPHVERSLPRALPVSAE